MLAGIEPVPTKTDTYFRHLKPAEKDYNRKASSHDRGERWWADESDRLRGLGRIFKRLA